jgi:hypothetical protein
MDEQKRILEDVRIIKSTLDSEEARLLLPPWAYFSWALVVAAGTGLSYFLYRGMGFSGLQLALTVWVPAIIIGGSFEMVGWLSWLKKEELVLRTDWMQRMLLSFCGVVVGLMALGFSLSASGSGLAGFFVISLSICFMTLGSYSWKEIFYEAYILLFIGVLMLLFANEGAAASLASGFICSAGFAAAGIHLKLLARRYDG